MTTLEKQQEPMDENGVNGFIGVDEEANGETRQPINSTTSASPFYLSKIFIASMTLLIVGGILAAVLATTLPSSDKGEASDAALVETQPNSSETPTTSPTSQPTASPTQCEWLQLGSDIDGEAAGDQSGHSVSISSDGRTMAIGAWGNDDNGSDSGHVRVYQYSGSGWIQLGSDIDGEAAGDNSGTLVSISSDGRTVAIGAYGNDANGSDSGHVRVYQRNGLGWVQLGSDIDGEASNDWSGWSVSISSDGRTVAIGAWRNGDNDSGHARVYQYSGLGWAQLGGDIDGEASGDQSGFSVSISSDGRTVAIGAPWNNGNGSDSGHVRVYQYTGSDWVQLGSDIDGEAEYDGSGFSVSISSDGRTVAIGAYGNDGNGFDSGHVRVYQYNGMDWVQLGSDLDGEAQCDESGISVSISLDGSTVAIGAWGNDGNGSASGHVRVYQYGGLGWVQLGSDIDGEAVRDDSGWSVSISSDGRTVAIGADLNDGNGSGSGHVRVYSLTCV